MNREALLKKYKKLYRKCAKEIDKVSEIDFNLGKNLAILCLIEYLEKADECIRNKGEGDFIEDIIEAINFKTNRDYNSGLLNE